MVAPTVYQDPNWYMDSGTSHHLTSNSINLTQSTPYSVHKDVLLENDKSTSISHIGWTNVIGGHLLLKLNNMLHVLQLAKDIIYVRQMCINNLVLIEIFS